MKLFDYFYQYDFGHEYYLNILCTDKLNVLQFNFDFSDGTGRPIILINIFGESFFGLTVSFWRLNFSFDVFAYFPRNLNHYQIDYDS